MTKVVHFMIMMMILHIHPAQCSVAKDVCVQCSVPLDGSETDENQLLHTTLKVERNREQVGHSSELSSDSDNETMGPVGLLGHFSKISSDNVSMQVPWQVPVVLWALLPLSAIFVVSSLAEEQHLKVQNRHIVLFCLLTQFVRSLDYTLIIPTVYDLAQTASTSSSAVISGFVISAYHGLAVAGVLLFHVKGLNAMPFRKLMILIMCSFPITGATYIASGLVPPGPLTLVLMISSRCAAGVVEGVVNVAQWSMLARVSHPSCATRVFVFYAMFEIAGEAYGPIFSSSCFDILGSHFQFNNVIPSVVMFFVHLTMLLLTVLTLGEPEHTMEKVKEERLNDEDVPEARQGHICAGLCLMLSILLYGVVYGLESATAMILEVHYSWSTLSSGFAIGACFGCVLPVLLLSSTMSKLVPERIMKQFSLLVMCCMTVLLFPQTCMLLQTRLHMFWGCDTIILLSVACVFSLACLVSGLANGLMSVLGGKQYADLLAMAVAVGTSFVSLVCQPCARYLIQQGIAFFASWQICLGALALLVNIAIDMKMPMKTYTATDPPEAMQDKEHARAGQGELVWTSREDKGN